MREIGTIADEKAARLLEDYLLTLGISARLDRLPDDGFRIWVLSEDRLPEAREALAALEADPGEERFQSAPRQARLLRRKAEQAEAEYRGNVREASDRFNNPFHRRVPLTAALLALSCAVGLVTDLGQTPGRFLFSTETVNAAGQVVSNGFGPILRGQVWRLITPIFLHFHVIHLVFNMLALIALGERVESRKGWRKMGLIVLVAAVLGNCGQYFESGAHFGGMSGVIFALAGYLWAKGYSDPEEGLGLHPNYALLMVVWFAFGILSKTDPNPAGPDASAAQDTFANVAHGVGLAVGMVFGLLRF